MHYFSLDHLNYLIKSIIKRQSVCIIHCIIALNEHYILTPHNIYITVIDFCSWIQRRWRKGRQKTKCRSVRKHFTYKLVRLIRLTIKWFAIPEGEWSPTGFNIHHYLWTYSTTHWENIRQSLLDAPITSKHGWRQRGGPKNSNYVLHACC